MHMAQILGPCGKADSVDSGVYKMTTKEVVEAQNFRFYKSFAPWISDECAWNWARNVLKDENGIARPDDMGLLYIATDTSRPDEYKIGRTSGNDPFKREMHTTSPNYRILYMAVSRDVVKDEARIHRWCKERLRSHIKYDYAKEWFKLDNDYLQFVIDKFHFVKAERPQTYMRWVGLVNDERIQELFDIFGDNIDRQCRDTIFDK